ncbi:TIGR04222 domain-containing membrane protein [Uniformispora flossi]|uniref:TIGR04222 domain-containing membrane protein n=1 Tax=Uniformispora flossi TaxID=3390723 RepID=UPI003C2E923B
MVWLVISALLFAAVGGFAMSVRRDGKATRAPVPEPHSLDLYHLAFLAGGPARAADVAVLAAQARGTVAVAGNGQVTAVGGDAPDAVAAGVLDAVRGGGGSPPLASVRVAVAESAAVQGLRESLFAQGLVNPAARHPRLTAVRVALCAVPLVAIAALFVDGLAGSPSDDTAIWVANLILALLGTAACGIALYALFTRYDRLRGPLTEHAIHYLWQQVRDPQGLRGVESTVAGGHGLGSVALGGVSRIKETALQAVFAQAFQVTSGRITSAGWAEQRWIDNANERGPLDGPSYVDLHEEAMRQQAPAHPAPGQPVPGFQIPPPTSGAAPYSPYSDGAVPWESAPGAGESPYGSSDPA